MTETLEFVEGARPAAAIMHPLRRRILESLREPGSASSLARQLGLPRQKVNYHLRELERHALVEFVEERRRGNCTERVFRAAARYFVISPRALGDLAADPDEIQDRFSSAYLAAVAARTVRDLGGLRVRSRAAGKRLATFTLEATVRFAGPEQRAAFLDELGREVARLVARYHRGGAPGGRSFRVLLGSYPEPPVSAKGPNPVSPGGQKSAENPAVAPAGDSRGGPRRGQGRRGAAGLRAPSAPGKRRKRKGAGR